MLVHDYDIPETPIDGRRLGRNVRHDDESRNYPAAQASELRTVTHRRHGPIFDQGPLGSCTGNALAAALMCDPCYRPGRDLDEAVARLLYSAGTRNDSVAGVWPPTDTGSSGLGVCKAAKAVGLIGGYAHTFSMPAALHALVLQSGIMGINWYSSFDTPGPDGLLTITDDAVVRGGHELVVRAVNVEMQRVGGDNSWGPGWGPVAGRWSMSWPTFERLLAEDGDVTFPLAA